MNSHKFPFQEMGGPLVMPFQMGRKPAMKEIPKEIRGEELSRGVGERGRETENAPCKPLGIYKWEVVEPDRQS